jgi:nucleoside-diphosphate-sugar epimerase
MHHLIIGYGYCGFYLASHLLKQGQAVTVLSRHQNPAFLLLPLNYLIQDISTALTWSEPETVLYYFVPPTSQGQTDTLLQQFISQSSLKLKKVVYCSSTAVYGDHQGAWVDEQALCHLHYSRQYSRLDAEKQWQDYCAQHSIDCIILRAAGIYGPQRLPVEAARHQSPLIHPEEAPFSNHIYVEDLAKITAQLALHSNASGLYNLADGQPQKMGTLQSLTAKALQIQPAPYASFKRIWEQASPMKREFMSASKRLSINALQQALPPTLSLTSLEEGVAASI